MSSEGKQLDVATQQLPSSALVSAIPHLFQLASNRSPALVNVSADQSSALANIMAVSQSGLALVCSTAQQEASDLATIATAAAIKARTPFLHYHDNEQSTALEADAKILDQLVTEQDLSQQQEDQSGAATAVKTAYLKYQAKRNEPVTDVLGIVQETLAQFAKVTGRTYAPLEYHGHPEAKHVVVAMGAAAAQVEEYLKKNKNASIGLVKIRVFRPFSASELVKIIPESVERIAVLEPQDYTATWNPIFLEVAAAFQVAGNDSVDIASAQYAAGAVTPAVIDTVFSQLKKDILERKFIVGGESEKDIPVVKKDIGTLPIETPYIKLLDQVFKERLEIANAVNSASVWSPDATKPETASPEYGFGKLVSKIQERARFIDAVEKSLKETKLSADAHKALSQWLLLAKSTKQQVDKTLDAAEAVVKALQGESASSSEVQSLLKNKELLQPKSNWLIGSDSWAYDIGQSGVHHVITSGENINMLIVDTTPYSSPVEREQRKKDIGLYAMNFGNVYVASVAIYSSYTGVLHALMEADAYQGPSIVLAYLPYAEKRNPLESLKESKVSVDNGSWPLYRWNPALEQEGKEPFTLDSQRVKKDLEAFLKRENHFSQLVAEHPDLSTVLVSSLESVSLKKLVYMDKVKTHRICLYI